MWDGFQMGQILWDFTSQCKIWHVWGIMGWTSSFLEITETWCADAFEKACSQKRKLETKVTFWNRCYKNNSTNNVYLLPGYLLSTDAILILSPGTAKPTKICAHSGDSDQPVLPSSLIRVLALHSISSQGSNVSSCWQQRLRPDSPNTQADLSLCWARMSFCDFPAQFLLLPFPPTQNLYKWAISWEYGTFHPS